MGESDEEEETQMQIESDFHPLIWRHAFHEPAWPQWIPMNPSPWYWNITDIRLCSETDKSKRWGKERSRLINPLGGTVGGQPWIMPAFVISDCLWSPLSHHTLELDYHSPKIKWISPTHRLRGYWNLNLFFLSLGTNPLCREREREREGRVDKLQPLLQLAFSRGRAS